MFCQSMHVKTWPTRTSMLSHLLRHLEIFSCGITGKWLSVMLRHAPALEELDLRCCNQISGLLMEEIESRSLNHTSSPRASSASNPDDVLTSSTPEGLLRIPSNLIPSLKKIFIVCCSALTFQGDKDVFSRFTSLEELAISGCPKLIPSLVHKYENSDQRNGRCLLPHSLVELDIDGCPETLQPCFLEDRSCLKKLQIRGSLSLKSLQLRSCAALEELGVYGCQSLAALEGNLTCLRTLKLHCNPRLKSLQLRSCTALEELVIDDCESLDAIGDSGSLTGLRYLDVFGGTGLSHYLEGLSSQGRYELCARLERLGTDDHSFLATSFCECLTSLRRLEYRELEGRQQVTRLTDEQERALELLTSLQELRFEYCHDLADLPVGLHSLPSLRRLEIAYCSSISRLPEKGLPPSLEELEITYCTEELTEQCRMLAATTSKPRVEIDEEYVN